jgi:hypothetical protein
MFQKSAVLQMVGRHDAALVGYHNILLRLRDNGDIPADAAWNSALIISKSKSRDPQALLTAIEYARMARALYHDPINFQHCTAKIAQLLVQYNSIVTAADSKAPQMIDIMHTDRSTRVGLPSNDKAIADAIEEEWAYVQRMYAECHSERVRERTFPKIMDIVTHLIEIDPLGR